MPVGRFISRALIACIPPFMSFLYVMFLCAGGLCAFISFLIEYQVFTEFLKKVGSMGFLFSLIPLLCALSLEVSKLFLAFYLKHLTSSNNKVFSENKITFNFLKVLRVVLVIISFACTLVFSFYNLHNPEYKTQLEEGEREIINRHEERVKESVEGFNDKMNASRYEVDFWKQKMIEESKTGIGPRFRETEKQYNVAIEKHEKNRSQYEAELSEKRQKSREKRDRELVNLEENLKSSRTAQNKMLSAMLQVISFSPNYPQELYTGIIFLISILLTFALETIIIGSSQVLAINHGDVFQASLSMENVELGIRNVEEAATRQRRRL